MLLNREAEKFSGNFPAAARFGSFAETRLRW